MENRSKNDAKIDRKIIMKTDNQNLEFLLPFEAGNLKMTFQRLLNPLKINEISMQKKLEVFQVALGIDFLSIFDGFLLQVGRQNRVKLDIKWCCKNDEKMMMTRMAKSRI